ncbi:BQ5605_C004g02842 [Microbotryum silenes-dioicae]|uniref:BQ5605_C004g02842 protein n=1 Tax=Microbotryum silenes-dioicae TaxID=796604 RepID=A0A2X0MW29_9BASI|nr:BQ5605_C004g02842 [Microbotryum silenes-dioicae]
MMPSYKPSAVLYDILRDDANRPRPRGGDAPTLLGFLLVALALTSLFLGFPSPFASLSGWVHEPTHDPATLKRWDDTLLRCERLDRLPGPPSSFNSRTESDRFVSGTKPTLIRNATIWTGAAGGHELLQATDVLLDRGLVVDIGVGLAAPAGAVIVESRGAWLTPGIFDMHSHISVDALPKLSSADDVNSLAGPVLPWLRSLDAINTHDLAFKRTVSGGVTTSLILPGSGNSVGGQAFPIKLRPTKEKTPDSRVVELPYNIAGNKAVWKRDDPPRWRHMKMACGENIRRFYQQTRLDLAWNFRSAFEKARKLMEEQDTFCIGARTAKKEGKVVTTAFPDDLQWEALVDVLRGKVKVNTHCYEVTDLAAFVRLTHEFNDLPSPSNNRQRFLFQFHHAHETYMVPDLLKSAYNNTPAVAIFATNGRYKREAWRGSEYAAKIHSENNITVVSCRISQRPKAHNTHVNFLLFSCTMSQIVKSDHPVLDSRFLLFEAQQAHHFGLPEHLALAAVTTSPATVAGFSHRLGFIKKNFDADVVLWDSHPLALGATPLQVWIDGIRQLDNAFTAKELDVIIQAPPIASIPNHIISHEEDDDGTQQGTGAQTVDGVVLFTNVSEVLLPRNKSTAALTTSNQAPLEVVVRSGRIECVGRKGECSNGLGKGAKGVNLEGGSILPPLLAFGPALGLTEIVSEPTTTDDGVFDPLYSGSLSSLQQIWGPHVAVRAVDGLEMDGKHLRTAHQIGITKAVTAPMGSGFFRGVSVAFRTGAKNSLEKGSIVKDAVALHITIVPLVINAWKADHLATLIHLKQEIEGIARSNEGGRPLKWIIHGGQEAHLVADELAQADISVILSPSRSFPASWDERRAVAGPPLSPQNAATILHLAGVRLGLGVPEEWQTRTLLWEAAWAQKTSSGHISRAEAIKWVSSNLEGMLELETAGDGEHANWVAYERDPFEFGSRAIAISNTQWGHVEFV